MSYTDLLKNKIRGKRCALLGLGVSNIPLLELLLSFDCASEITVYDKKDIDELSEEAREFEKRGVRFITGKTCFDDIRADIIFRSPGIRPDTASIPREIESGAILTSEIEELLNISPARSFAITGSDGKTTTTTLCGKFLSSSSRVFVGGNIGTPLLDRLDEMQESDSLVLELSSFQLMRVSRSPFAVAITNLSQNHLDWHKDFEEYISAKKNAIGKDTKRVVLNADCDITRAIAEEIAVERPDIELFVFSSKKNSYAETVGTLTGAKAAFIKDGYIVLSDGKREENILTCSEVRLPGTHNLENYMTAICLCYGFAKSEIFASVAREFGGVEHRLEFIRQLDGVDYYNSSIDSSPSRTAAALSALQGRDITVICGGYDKNLDYTPLAESIARSTVSTVVLTGATAGKIHAALLSCEGTAHGQINILRASDFENALLLARESARRGGCVLLSPASASFDAFKNFAERGRYFKKLVCELD